MTRASSNCVKFPFLWFYRAIVCTYYKGEQLVWNKPTWNSLNTPAEYMDSTTGSV